MSGLGNTLKFAREQRGLSIAQVAETTHISQNMIELIEREDFSMIPAPLYGRGFVKLISQAVGLDPKPMLEQFMQLYDKDGSGAKSAPRHLEPVAAEPPPPVARSFTSAPAEEEPQSAPTPRNIPSSRYAAPQPIDERPSITSAIFNRLRCIPAHVWRLAALAVAAAILVTLIFFAVRAVYRATGSMPAEDTETVETPSAETVSPSKTAPAAAPAETKAEEKKPDAETGDTPSPAAAKPRRGTVIEPLYVD